MIRWASWLVMVVVVIVMNGCGGGGGEVEQPPPTVNHPPSVPVLVSPSNGSTVTPTPAFKLKSQDPDGDQVRFEIEVVKGSEKKTFVTDFVSSGSEATFTVPEDQALSEGQWSWRAKAIDSKGAESGWSGAWTFIVQVQDTTPPKISSPQVNPTKLRFTGGEVTISAVVSDPSGVERAWAVVRKPDGTSMEVSLSPAGGDSYKGTFKVESNIRNDGQSLIYRIWLKARDKKGNETPQPGVPSEGLTVEVTAPLPPQKPPSF